MKYFSSLVLCALLSGCVSQSFQKAVGILPNSEICVVKNRYVRNDFFLAYRETLHNAGFKTKEISKPGECSVYSTYTAQYAHHWGLYLARANLKFFKDDQLVGSASYKAPRADPSKHGRVQGKIQKLVDGVFSG